MQIKNVNELQTATSFKTDVAPVDVKNSSELNTLHINKTSQKSPCAYHGLYYCFHTSHGYILSVILALWIIATLQHEAHCMVFGYRGPTTPQEIPMDTETFLYFLTYSPEEICKQQSLVRHNLKISDYCNSRDVTQQYIHIGMANGYKICQSMFQQQRWNCTFKHNFLNSGYPQASFVWAITTSKAVEEVVMACRKGVPDLDCKCPYANPKRKRKRKNRNRDKRSIGIDPKQLTMLKPEKIKEKYGTPSIPTCDDNIRQAIKSIRFFFNDSNSKFLGGQHGFMEKVNYHNRRAGTIIVKKSQTNICHCLGTSGSCSRKVCIKGLRRHSRKIETSLSDLFKEAKQVVEQKNLQKKGLLTAKKVKRKADDKLFWVDYSLSKVRKARKKHLVYHKPPPNFCNSQNPDGFHGVQGRACNNSLPYTNAQSCTNLCCENGYYTQHRQDSSWCDCKLDYNPIKVNCKRCMTNVEIHICRGNHNFFGP